MEHRPDPRDPLERLAALEAEIKADQGGEAPDARVSAKELARLLDISRAMNRIHDRDQLLTYVSDRLRELFDAQNSFVVLFDEHGSPVIQSSSMDLAGLGPFPVSETLLRRVRESREPLIVDDTALHDDLRDRSSIERLRIASVLCAPLIVEGEVIGVLQFDQRGEPHPFPDSDLRLVSLFSGLVATALYNLQLIERLNGALEDTRSAQEALVRAERLSVLGEMAAGIAHNFNNTLFVALGLCDVMLSKESLVEEDRESVERIRTCALDAANTVRRLHFFAQGKKPEDVLETVSPADVLADVRELSRHKWRDEATVRGLSLEMVVVVADSPRVRGSASDLREVLTNLVFNAVDAMEGDGVITLSCGSRGGEVFLSVRDQGAGMTEPVQQKLFQPFFTTKGARGHGFGLSTSWSIAHRLGGRIEVDSEPGHGSTFTVWLPVAADERTRPSRGGALSVRTARVLVVDDDATVLDTVSELVRVLGHEPDPFTSGEDAVAAFEDEPHDAVVSDLGMPGFTGNDLAREIERIRPGTPVLLLTGWGVEPELPPESSVREVLAKPVTLQDLGAALLRVLD